MQGTNRGGSRQGTTLETAAQGKGAATGGNVTEMLWPSPFFIGP